MYINTTGWCCNKYLQIWEWFWNQEVRYSWEDFEDRVSKNLKSLEESFRFPDIEESASKCLKESQENIIGNWRKEVFVQWWQKTKQHCPQTLCGH